MRTIASLPARPRVALVGPGRLGTALAARLPAAGCEVLGPHGRGAAPQDADVVLLTVPDAEIARAAALIPPGPPVGHCSGALTLAPLAGHDAFSLHPLMTVTGPATDLAGAACAVAGASPRALAVAHELADRLGLRPFAVADEDRAAYHAAASAAANFLVTLEQAAARLGATAGVPREALLPLARAALENWGRDGEAALTGPIARGDEETVARQRAAVQERAPELVGLWDALADGTRELVR